MGRISNILPRKYEMPEAPRMGHFTSAEARYFAWVLASLRHKARSFEACLAEIGKGTEGGAE